MIEPGGGFGFKPVHVCCTCELRVLTGGLLGVCRKCGAKIFSDAPRGLCTACVLETALGIFPDAPVAADDLSAVARTRRWVIRGLCKNSNFPRKRSKNFTQYITERPEMSCH